MYLLKNFRTLLIDENKNISDVIKKINLSKNKILFVVDDQKKTLGSVTSGDIRRSITRRDSANFTVKNIMNKKFQFVYENDEDKINKIKFDNELIAIPVLNKKKKIKHIWLIRNNYKIKKIIPIVIMAGGKGTRLLPITKKIPKPLLKINNKPIIQRIIFNFKKQGFNEFIVVVNYLAQKIIKFLSNGKKLKINVSYIKENSFLGTVGSLSLLDLKKIPDYIILTNSDLITNLDYNNLLSYHKKKKADLTICAKNKFFEMPYGEIMLRNNQLSRIIEKPISSYLINAGVYVISKEIIYLLKKNKKKMMNDFIEDLIKKKKKLLVIPFMKIGPILVIN